MCNVAYCMGKNYQQHFGASVMSLLLNFRGQAEKLRIFVVTDDADNDFRGKLDRLSETFKASICLHVIDNKTLENISNLYVTRRMPRSTYFRLLLPSLLPMEVDKLIYLDSDTIVLDSVKNLYDEDLHGNPVAGVQDIKSVDNSKRLATDHYINAGVLLIDLNIWRTENLSTQCIEWLTAHPEKAKHHDQCAINAVNSGRITLLDSQWNSYILSWAKMDSTGGMPAILHFIHNDKPWHSWYGNEWRRYYWKYLDVSPWKGAVPSQPATIIEAHKLARLLSAQGKAAEASAVYENILASIKIK